MKQPLLKKMDESARSVDPQGVGNLLVNDGENEVRISSEEGEKKNQQKLRQISRDIDPWLTAVKRTINTC